MSRYRGPRLRLVRRIGVLPGLTKKISKKTTFPGQITSSFTNRKYSLFNLRLREKQKLRFHYGVSERQLLSYVKLARKKKGSSGRILLTLLEMRLDNIIFRLGFAPSVFSARQMVNHGHIFVDGVNVSIPSFICKPRNLITVRNSQSSINLVRANIEKFGNSIIPQHLSCDSVNFKGKVVSYVNRKSISLLINELLVIEYYSRML